MLSKSFSGKLESDFLIQALFLWYKGKWLDDVMKKDLEKARMIAGHLKGTGCSVKKNLYEFEIGKKL